MTCLRWFILSNKATLIFQSLTEAMARGHPVHTTSRAEKMMMQKIMAFAAVERAMLRERTKHRLDVTRLFNLPPTTVSPLLARTCLVPA